MYTRCGCGGRYEVLVEIVSPDSDYIETEVVCEKCGYEMTIKERL